MNILEKISEYIPSVKPPLVQLTTEEKIKNTFIIIALYTLLASIPIWGISPEISQRIQTLMLVIGSSFGTLATLGVGPIILAGILLQIFVGSGILNINIFTEEGKRKYDQYYKSLAFIFILLEALVVVFSRGIVPMETIFIPTYIMYLIIYLQIVAGGIIILLLDDFSSKYGITSGINLIIFTSISLYLTIRLFGWDFLTMQPSGYITNGIFQLLQGNILLGLSLLFASVFTFVLLILVSYLQGLKIEIPLFYINVGGKIQKFTLNILYTSVIPVIFLYAIIVMVEQIFGFDQQNLIVTLVSPPHLLTNLGLYGPSYLYSPQIKYVPFLGQVAIPFLPIIHTIFYLLLFILGGIAFSKMWMIASGLDPATIAKQLMSSPVSSLRYRDPRVIEETLNKYVNPLAVVSGALVGTIAAIADIIGIPIVGTSLLLLLLIAYGMYMDLERNGALHLLPIVGKYLSK